MVTTRTRTKTKNLKSQVENDNQILQTISIRFTFTNLSHSLISTVDTFDLNGISNCLCHYRFAVSALSVSVQQIVSTFDFLVSHRRHTLINLNILFHLITFLHTIEQLLTQVITKISLNFIAVITKRSSNKRKKISKLNYGPFKQYTD